MEFNLTPHQKELAKWIDHSHDVKSLPESFDVSFLGSGQGLYIAGGRYTGRIGNLPTGVVSRSTFKALEKEELLIIEDVQPVTVKDGDTTYLKLQSIRVTITGRLRVAVQEMFGQTKPLNAASGAKAGSDNKAPTRFDTAAETYTFKKALGEGGAGVVFEVTNEDGELLALKCLKPGGTSSKRKRFKNELGFSIRNQHVNLVRVLDSGVASWKGQIVPFYVMPHFESNFRSVVGQSGISPGQKLSLFAQVLDGVEAAHLLGVVHRDLKPENILFNAKSEHVAVADFGIAQFSDELMMTLHETQEGELLCNRHYLAPEQHTPNSKVDRRADIFALGLMLNELFTGLVPYGSNYKTIAAVAPELSYLDALVEKMIQSDPHLRFSDIAQVKNELIAAKNAFVRQQRLDALRGQVIPSNTPESVPPVSVVDLDLDGKQLVLKLNREPEERWKFHFRNLSLHGMTINLALEPASYQFLGNTARVHVRQELRQEAINQFVRFSELATRKLQQQHDQTAKDLEEADRRRLESQTRLEEERIRGLDGLKIPSV